MRIHLRYMLSKEAPARSRLRIVALRAEGKRVFVTESKGIFYSTNTQNAIAMFARPMRLVPAAAGQGFPSLICEVMPVLSCAPVICDLMDLLAIFGDRRRYDCPRPPFALVSKHASQRPCLRERPWAFASRILRDLILICLLIGLDSN